MREPILYLVRHGETAWHREGRIQGHLDAPLTERGIAQARHAGLVLRELLDRPAPWVLRFSPLGRTRHTTAIIAALIEEKLAAQHADERLKEVSWGVWQGLTRSEIARCEPAAWQRREADPWRFTPPDGESHAMPAARAAAWLESVADEPRLVVVGHGAWSRALRGAYLDLSIEQAMA
ncbi:MAG: histidine phosphatase family protein, partial [Geminicoccaceae bacterium]